MSPPPTIPLLAGWWACGMGVMILAFFVPLGLAAGIPIFAVMGGSLIAIVGQQIWYERNKDPDV